MFQSTDHSDMITQRKNLWRGKPATIVIFIQKTQVWGHLSGQTSQWVQHSRFRKLRKTKDNWNWFETCEFWSVAGWEEQARMRKEAERWKSSRRRALSCPCATSDGGAGTAASSSAAAVSSSCSLWASCT